MTDSQEVEDLAETFSLEAEASYSDESKAWEAVRILAECVEHVQPGGHLMNGPGFLLLGDNKRWERQTVRELAVIREKFDIKYSALLWDYVTDGLHWSVGGWMFNAKSQKINVKAYAGSSLLGTEEALRTVVSRAQERGVEMMVKQVEISATESTGSPPSREIQVNTSPMRKWKMFRAWVGPHLAAYIVGIVSSISATGLLVWLGLGG